MNKMPHRILLVDDEAHILRLTALSIRKGNYDIITARNGLEAIELIEQHDFDVCLMDLDMPELDGIQATILLRNRGIVLPIYAMTAHHDQEHEDKSLEAGMTGFLTKPINPKDLQLILELVAKSKTEPRNLTMQKTIIESSANEHGSGTAVIQYML